MGFVRNKRAEAVAHAREVGNAGTPRRIERFVAKQD